MEYTVIIGSDVDFLVYSVRTKIREGWQPLGGISTVMTGSGVQYAQAMTKVQS